MRRRACAGDQRSPLHCGVDCLVLSGPRVSFERTLAAVCQHIERNVRNELVGTAQQVEFLGDQRVTGRIDGRQDLRPCPALCR